MQIKLILSDLDGTLVDTQKANYHAYSEVLRGFNYKLTEETYNALFGLRLNDFLAQIGITDKESIEKIRQRKKILYPNFFKHLVLNKNLLDLIIRFKESGYDSGLISTAQRHNILNVLGQFNISHLFDIIVSGDEIPVAKPDPSAYLFAMEELGYSPEETLIFEDSKTGIEAAQRAGSPYIKINHAFFKH